MKRHQKWIAVLTAACMAVPLFALAACGGDKEQNKANVDSDIWAVYTAYAEAAGDDALSYDEWYAQLLATAKGAPGDDGKSAYEIWQEHHPEEETTEAEWLESLKGENGAKGNGWYYGSGAPEVETGSVGDLYLDYATWDVYAKQASGEGAEWNYLGNLAGKAQRHTIAASGTYEIPIDLEAGVYELTVELDEGDVSVDGLSAKVGDGAEYWLYNSLDDNYWGALLVEEGDTTVTITNHTSGNIVAGFKLKEYKAPTLKAGKEFCIPSLAYLSNKVENNILIPYDAAMADGETQYYLTATPDTEQYIQLLSVYYGLDDSATEKTLSCRSSGNWKSDAFTFLQNAKTHEMAFRARYTSSKTPVSANVIVKIEVAEAV